VIDATDGRALLAGRILADLGADVLQLEPPGGAGARSANPRGPGGASYVWDSLAAGKRTIGVDIHTNSGRDLVLELCRRADILLTSRVGENAGPLAGSLDIQSVRLAITDLICVAVTPFGSTGPKASVPASDLTIWAAGGPLALVRDSLERPPLRITAPQAWLHAGADAAVGALLAFLAKRRYGVAQFVDVSAQASVTAATLGWSLAHAVGETIQEPGGGFDARRPDQLGSASTGGSHRRWHCADGMVDLNLTMSPAAGGFTNRFFAWMGEEGACEARMGSWDWRSMRTYLSDGVISEADLSQARALVAAFLATKTKQEVLEAALRRKLTCVPVYDIADVAEDAQLSARGFWSNLHAGPRTTTLPGRFARVSGAAGPAARSPAPEFGDDNVSALERWPVQRRTELAPDAAPASGVLGGLRVLDLSWVVAGPLIGRTLADFGATVVRVESSTHIETARTAAPFIDGRPGPENSALYSNCNAGKLGLTLNLSIPEGRAVVRDLARWADVVIESFAPGKLAEWGLDYDSLSDGRDDLIMLSTSMAGQTGPRAKLAGYGSLGASLSGFQALAGWPDRAPVGPFGPYTDYLGPRLSLAALLAAIGHRDRTGAGSYIDVALVECGAYFLAPELAAYFGDGLITGADGNADPDYLVHGVYPCQPDAGRDRFIAIAAKGMVQVTQLAQALGLPPAMDSVQVRGIDSVIADRTAGWDACSLQEALWARGVPAHVVASSQDLAEDAQLRHRGHYVQIGHALHGETVVEAPRYLLSQTPGGPRSAAPLMGEHTRTALSSLLGYDAERLATLGQAGALR
jgi:crotonobetainyl-CoA:carnitine CoA-transferase CaiB-like acyl-CoA transferase